MASITSVSDLENGWNALKQLVSDDEFEDWDDSEEGDNEYRIRVIYPRNTVGLKYA